MFASGIFSSKMDAEGMSREGWDIANAISERIVFRPFLTQQDFVKLTVR